MSGTSTIGRWLGTSPSGDSESADFRKAAGTALKAGVVAAGAAVATGALVKTASAAPVSSLEMAPLDKVELSGNTETAKSMGLDGIFSGLFKFLESLFGGGGIETSGTNVTINTGHGNVSLNPSGVTGINIGNTTITPGAGGININTPYGNTTVTPGNGSVGFTTPFGNTTVTPGSSGIGVNTPFGNATINPGAGTVGIQSQYGSGNLTSNGSVTDFTAGANNAIKAPVPAASAAQSAFPSMLGSVAVMAGAGVLLAVAYKVLSSMKS